MDCGYLSLGHRRSSYISLVKSVGKCGSNCVSTYLSLSPFPHSLSFSLPLPPSLLPSLSPSLSSSLSLSPSLSLFHSLSFSLPLPLSLSPSLPLPLFILFSLFIYHSLPFPPSLSLSLPFPPSPSLPPFSLPNSSIEVHFDHSVYRTLSKEDSSSSMATVSVL